MEGDQLDLKKPTETPSMTEGSETGPTAPVLTTPLSETATLSVSESIKTTANKEDQIVTLLPGDESDGSDKTSSPVTQEAEKERVKAPQDQQYSGVRECREHTPHSCSFVISLKEYLLQSCILVSPHQKKKTNKKSQESQAQPGIFRKTETSVPVISVTTSSFTQVPHTGTVERTSSKEASVVVDPSFSESKPELDAGSLHLAPSLNSALVTLASSDTSASRATDVVDFLDPSAVESFDVKLNEENKNKPVEDKNSPVLTSHMELSSTPVLTTQSDDVDQVQVSGSLVANSTTENSTLTPSMMTSTMDQATFSSQSTLTDQSFVQRTASKDTAPVVTPTAVPGTEPLEVVSGVAEPKNEELVEEPPHEGHSGNNQSETSSNAQPVQPPSSDFYAEIPVLTEAPSHSSNQKESVFMRLNNRIKALEVNMSLSGRYLEQLSQR